MIKKVLNDNFLIYIIMDPRMLFFYSYLLLGLSFVIFNKSIGSWVYKLTLLFTDKLNLSELFVFRIDEKNRDSFFFLMRTFSISFGLMIMVFVMYVFFT